MTTYYISTDGDNTTDGTTSNSPWADFTNIDTDIAAGDIIKLRYGSTWNAGITLPVSGTSDAVITLTSYDTDAGAQPKLIGADEPTGFDADTDYVYKKTIKFFKSTIFHTISASRTRV